MMIDKPGASFSAAALDPSNTYGHSTRVHLSQLMPLSFGATRETFNQIPKTEIDNVMEDVSSCVADVLKPCGSKARDAAAIITPASSGRVTKSDIVVKSLQISSAPLITFWYKFLIQAEQ
jgi:hypothetical protein